MVQDGKSGDPPRVKCALASLLRSGRLAGLAWSLRFVHAGCLLGCYRRRWSVFDVGHLKVVDGQADCCKACRNDGKEDQDVKEQKIL